MSWSWVHWHARTNARIDLISSINLIQWAKVTRIRSNCLDILMMSLREIGEWAVYPFDLDIPQKEYLRRYRLCVQSRIYLMMQSWRYRSRSKSEEQRCIWSSKIFPGTYIGWTKHSSWPHVSCDHIVRSVGCASWCRLNCRRMSLLRMREAMQRWSNAEYRMVVGSPFNMLAFDVTDADIQIMCGSVFIAWVLYIRNLREWWALGTGCEVL